MRHLWHFAHLLFPLLLLSFLQWRQQIFLRLAERMAEPMKDALLLRAVRAIFKWVLHLLSAVGWFRNHCFLCLPSLHFVIKFLLRNASCEVLAAALLIVAVLVRLNC